MEAVDAELDVAHKHFLVFFGIDVLGERDLDYVDVVGDAEDDAEGSSVVSVGFIGEEGDFMVF